MIVLKNTYENLDFSSKIDWMLMISITFKKTKKSLLYREIINILKKIFQIWFNFVLFWNLIKSTLNLGYLLH